MVIGGRSSASLKEVGFRTREDTNKMTKRGLVMWSAAGAAAMYFFDPEQGRTRRAKVRDTMVKIVKRGQRTAESTGQAVSAQASAVKEKAAHRGEETPPENDETLRDKIQSEVLTRHNYPKGDINVNVENGVVYLRGQVNTEDQLSALDQEVRKVTGVVDVQNLIRVPAAPAPSKDEGTSGAQEG
jgi:osmotically-inducible protein OsmY